MTSRIPGFYRLSVEERRAAVAAAAGLGAEEAAGWARDLPEAVADAMIENVVGTFALPQGVAVNVRLNGEDRLVPMVVEEPSVVAAVSNMARLCRPGEGIVADADASVMIGQVQIVDLPDVAAAAEVVRGQLGALAALVRDVHPELARLGGGLRGFDVRTLRYDEPGEAPEDMLVLHFFLDCVDAMGANMVNTVAERLAPALVAMVGGRPGLRILSNLADRRLVRATVRIDPALFSDANDEDPIDGAEVAAGIASAYRFAWADPYRAATHNKGIMNGIDAVALATGNDWRAIEAGAHSYASKSGVYRPLSAWKVAADGRLVGRIELPLQVGTVGGAIRVHPTVKANLRVAGVRGAADLAMLMAAVGLVQNLGALRALATEGIQQGHMRMHARTVALGAGATGDEIPAVVERLVEVRHFTLDAALAVLSELRAR